MLTPTNTIWISSKYWMLPERVRTRMTLTRLQMFWMRVRVVYVAPKKRFITEKRAKRRLKRIEDDRSTACWREPFIVLLQSFHISLSFLSRSLVLHTIALLGTKERAHSLTLPRRHLCRQRRILSWDQQNCRELQLLRDLDEKIMRPPNYPRCQCCRREAQRLRDIHDKTHRVRIHSRCPGDRNSHHL